MAFGIAAAGTAAAVATDDATAADSVGSAATILAQLGILLPFSRLHESESDHIGTILMAKAGYDPRKAITVWEKMEKEQGGSSRLAGFFSTHPIHADRIADLRKMMPEALEYYEKSSKQP